MIVLGLNAIGHHDASACILVDGEIVAFAEEERFTRSKHALGQVPLNAMHFCLDQAGVPLHAVDYIATPWMEEEGAFSAPPGCRPEVTFDLKISDPQYADSSVFHRLFQRFSLGNLPPVAHVSHHLAHAASAFRCSGLEEASILVVDGEGDRVSTTLAHGRQGNIRLIRQFPTAFSLGQFYACITNFLGLGNMGEGKTMGLAAYGSPDAHAEFPFTLESDGYRVNLPLSGDIWDPSEVNWHTIIDAWMKVLAKSWGSPSAPVAKFDSMRGAISYDPAFERLNRDLAAAAQNALQEVLLHLAKLLIAETSCPSLVVAGGVGLNCSANGALLKLDDVETLFVQPISSDAGAPLGAALELSAQLGYGPGGRMDHTALDRKSVV